MSHLRLRGVKEVEGKPILEHYYSRSLVCTDFREQVRKILGHAC